MGFADYWEKRIMETMFGILAATGGLVSAVTTNLWLGLSSADPLDTGSGVSEPGPAADGHNVSGTKGYYRIKVGTGGGTSFQTQSATGCTVENAVELAFPAATADWGDMTHFVLFTGTESSTTAGSSVCASGALTVTPKTVQSGDTAKFAAQALQICLK